MKAMILAAGLGTRLRPYTDRTPKPAIPFLGVPLINYVHHLACLAGANRFIVNVHHLPNELYKVALAFSKNIEFSDETKQIMDSGGAIHQAKKLLENEDNFIVLNGDEILFLNSNDQLREAYQFHCTEKNLATLCVKKHPGVGHIFGGAWTAAQSASGQIQCFSKKPVDECIGWHYTGILFLNHRIFEYMSPVLKPENILYDILTRAIAQKEKVKIYELDCEWFEIGNPNDFLKATKECYQGLQEHEQNKSKSWIKNLIQFLKTQAIVEPLVEKQESDLSEKILKLRQKINQI